MKTQVLLMEPLLNINKVFYLVIQQERQLTRNIVHETNVFMNTREKQA